MDSNVSLAVSTAIKHIGTGVYSSGKIYAYLIQKGFTPSVSSCAVKDLIEREYIDDYRAGMKIVKSRVGKKQESRRYITERLKQGGIARDSIRDIVDDLKSDYDTCLSLFISSYPCLPEDYDDNSLMREMLSLAAKRGYSLEVAQSSFNKWLHEI